LIPKLVLYRHKGLLGFHFWVCSLGAH